ncbi:MAG: DUF624 domain-containing protein [Firmicutes bacterium]|nr:DUF624 domain-containing protein [Bacillota bacterium]
MAGFFGFFDYTKPGKGVEKVDFAPGFKTFFQILFERFWKLISLNLLHVFCSIPLIAVLLAFVPVGDDSLMQLYKVCVIGLLYLSVVGVAPFITGFTYVLRNYTDDRHAWVFSDFFEHIRKNFKQAGLLFLIDSAIAIIIPFIFSFYTNIASPAVEASEFIKNISIVARTFVAMFAAVYFMMHFYIYQIMITFDMKLRQIIKNSLIFTLSHLPRNIGVLALIVVIAGLSFGYSIMVGILLGIIIVPTIIGYTVSFIVQPVIKKHMIKQEEPELS